VQMCDELEQQLVSELTVTEVQLCQIFTNVQHPEQSSTEPLIQGGVTQIQLSTQGSAQELRPSHCVPLTVHRKQGQQLEEDSLTDPEQEEQSRLLGCSSMNVNKLVQLH